MKNRVRLLIKSLLVFCWVITISFAEELENEDIVAMIKSGIKAELVKEKIRKSDNMFDVTADAMVKLRNSGVPDDVIQAMLKEAERTESQKVTRINVYIQSLASPRKEARQAAYLSLLKMGRIAQNRMMEVLTDTRDPKVKAALAEAMGKMKVEDSVPYLRVMADDATAEVRIASGDALYLLLEKDECRKISEKGMMSWRGTGENYAEAYIRMAGHLADKKDAAFMMRVLSESPNASEREMAAWALANMYDGKDSTRELLERTMIVDSSVEVKNQAASTLGIIGDPKSIDAFGKAIRAKGASRTELFKVMGTFKDKSVIPILITCFGIEDLKDDEEMVLVDVLRRTTHEDFGNQMAKWLEWWEKNELRLAKDELEKSNSDPKKFRELMEKR